MLSIASRIGGMRHIPNVAAGGGGWGFIRRVGNQLYDGPNPVRFSGVNIHWMGLDFSSGGWNPPPTGVLITPSQWRVEQGYKTAVMMGANVVRQYSMGVNYGYAGTLYPTMGGALNETVAVAIDYAIDRARAYGLRLIIPLAGSDPHHYYSGEVSVFSEWGGDEFYTSATSIANFKAYIALLLNRVNTINGLAYKDDPTIMCWETGNETSPTDEWTAEICAYIKSLAPKQLTMDGKFGIAAAALLNDNVDIVNDHFYPMSTARLASDLATENLSNKVFCVGEYDYNSTRGGGVTLATFLTALEAARASIGIDMWWDLCGPSDTYGFQASYQQHTVDPENVGTNMAYGDPDVQAKAELLRAHTWTMRSIAAPGYPVTEAPVLAAGAGVTVTWRGVACAENYRMERSTTGAGSGFEVVSSALTEKSSPWTDPDPPTGPASAWYRVSGINGDGIVGAVSGVLEVAYPEPPVNWWEVVGATCLAAYQPVGAADYAASKTNLANPGTYDAADGIAYPTWAAETGWTFDGASQYLATGITPTTDMTFILRLSGCVDGNRYAFGAYRTAAPSTLIGISPLSGGKAYFYYHRYGNYALATGAAAGVFAINTTNAFLNGSSVGALSTPVASEPEFAFFLGCLNTAGSPNYYLSGQIQAAAIYSTSLTPEQIATVSAAMEAL